MRPSEFEIDLGPFAMNCTAADVGTVFSALLVEIQAVAPKLREDEREILRKIMSHESKALTVGDVFPQFGRESEGHKTLRRLRAAQFVRPAKTGRWDPDERIEVKPFARLVWDRVGEEGLFAAPPARLVAVPTEVLVDLDAASDNPPDAHWTEPAGEVIDLDNAAAEPPTHPKAVPEEEVVDLEAAAAEWNDDAIMDILRDPNEN